MFEKVFENDDSKKTERLSTADLANAHPEDPKTVELTPVEVVRLRKEQERATTLSEPVASRTVSSGAMTATGAATAVAKEHEAGPLFPAEEAASLRSQWDAIQVGFVDEPRKSVEQADSLVAAAIKRLAEQFADERAKLEGQWDRGSEISTEDLRQALRKYRSFFGRLLSV
jgi:hypothetical protein